MITFTPNPISSKFFILFCIYDTLVLLYKIKCEYNSTQKFFLQPNKKNFFQILFLLIQKVDFQFFFKNNDEIEAFALSKTFRCPFLVHKTYFHFISKPDYWAILTNYLKWITEIVFYQIKLKKNTIYEFSSKFKKSIWEKIAILCNLIFSKKKKKIQPKILLWAYIVFDIHNKKKKYRLFKKNISKKKKKELSCDQFFFSCVRFQKVQLKKNTFLKKISRLSKLRKLRAYLMEIWLNGIACFLNLAKIQISMQKFEKKKEKKNFFFQIYISESIKLLFSFTPTILYTKRFKIVVVFFFNEIESNIMKLIFYKIILMIFVLALIFVYFFFLVNFLVNFIQIPIVKNFLWGFGLFFYVFSHSDCLTKNFNYETHNIHNAHKIKNKFQKLFFFTTYWMFFH